MAKVKLNVGSFFKLCIWDRNTNKYSLEYDSNSRAFGTISEDLLKKIIDINIDVLTRLLGFNNVSVHLSRAKQIAELFELASKYSQEREIKVLGYDINELLKENMAQLTNFLDTHFEQSIDDIIYFAPDVVQKYNNYGKELKKLIDEKKYNEIIELLFKVNDITMEFSLHLLLTMLNISYLLFMDLSMPTVDDCNMFPHIKNKDVTYCLDLEIIATRLAYGSLQQFIVNEDRKFIYQEQLLANLKDKYNFPAHILQSKDTNEIELYVYNNICKYSKTLKSVYPYLAIKRKINVEPCKIYNIWNRLDNNKKSEIALSFGFKKGDTFDMLPYILTIGTSHVDRIKEYSKYTIHTLLSQLDKHDIDNFTDIIKQYDDIFDYILYPDRKNVIEINEKISNELNREPSNEFININAFEVGKYNGKYLLNNIFIGKGQYIKKIIHKLTKQKT